MAMADSEVLAEDFLRAAEFLDGGYDIAQSVTRTKCAPDTPLFKGELSAWQLPCGLRLSTCDILALCDSVHEALVPRSLFIALAMDGEPGDYAFDTGRGLPLLPGGAIKVSASDATSLVGSYRKGQHFRSMLIQADPEALLDEHLASRVDALLTATAWESLYFPPRALSLTNEVSGPATGDCVSGLLLESCALEMLARSLQAAPSQTLDETAPISRKDRERMSVVRDAITAAPERPYHLSELARQAGVSVTSLKTKFPAVFGQPVFAFLRDIRLERARRGLEEDGWTVSQAAYYSGYRHPSNFSTAFQRKYRVSPSEVRRP